MGLSECYGPSQSVLNGELSLSSQHTYIETTQTVLLINLRKPGQDYKRQIEKCNESGHVFL